MGDGVLKLNICKQNIWPTTTVYVCLHTENSQSHKKRSTMVMPIEEPLRIKKTDSFDVLICIYGQICGGTSVGG